MLKFLLILLALLIIGSSIYFVVTKLSPFVKKEQNERENKEIEERLIDGFSFDSIPHEELETSMIIEPLRLNKRAKSNQGTYLEGSSISDLKGNVAKLEKKVDEVDKKSKKEDQNIYSKFNNYMEKTVAEKKLNDIKKNTESVIESSSKENDNKLKRIALQQKIDKANMEARNALQTKALNDNFKKYD